MDITGRLTIDIDFLSSTVSLPHAWLLYMIRSEHRWHLITYAEACFLLKVCFPLFNEVVGLARTLARQQKQQDIIYIALFLGLGGIVNVWTRVVKMSPRVQVRPDINRYTKSQLSLHKHWPHSLFPNFKKKEKKIFCSAVSNSILGFTFICW